MITKKQWITGALAAVTIGAPNAKAASVKAVHRFTYSNKSPSHYALGASPQAELLLASDGNFYGTTFYGGSGLCPGSIQGSYSGCGTIFRMTPQGTVTLLYSFPYDTATGTAPNGAFPTAGLIQGKDGNLYGVAQDGGVERCNGALGCGTAFRISTGGAFKLLHQFCGAGDSGTCQGVVEGGRPSAHLVQAANGLFYGTAAQGGSGNEGTVFSMSANGDMNTVHLFHYEDGTDGYDPTAPLLLAPDGKTLYGTTALGGVNGNSVGGGIVFSLLGTKLTILHAFDDIQSGTPGTAYNPLAGLIFGADGNLYGLTASGGSGGVLYSLATNGSGFATHYVFNGNTTDFGGTEPVAALLLASNGLMYGSALMAAIQGNDGSDGAVFSYDPASQKLKGVANFTTASGAQSRGALIEAPTRFLYGTTSLYGNTAHDSGSVFEIVPALTK